MRRALLMASSSRWRSRAHAGARAAGGDVRAALGRAHLGAARRFRRRADSIARVGGASARYRLASWRHRFQREHELPGNEVNQVGVRRALLVLVQRPVVTGRLSDIGGTNPLRISVHTDAGNGTSVERGAAHLLRAAGGSRAVRAPPTQGLASMRRPRADRSACREPALGRYRPYRAQGERVTFSASGQVRLSSDANDTAGPGRTRADDAERTHAGDAGRRPHRPRRHAAVRHRRPDATFHDAARRALFLRVNDDT